MNMDTGVVRAMSELTERERKSGKWVPLPSHDENGRPIPTPSKVTIVPHLDPMSGLARDAKPEAKRRAMRAKEAARELLPPASGIVLLDEISDEERHTLLGIASATEL